MGKVLVFKLIRTISCFLKLNHYYLIMLFNVMQLSIFEDGLTQVI